jgi:hypothetical protein
MAHQPTERAMQVEQQQSLACSATKRFTGNLLPTFKLMNISLQDGVIVNLGAALVHPGRSQHSAFDDAWNIFFSSSPELNLSMVAFEGQAKALKDNDRVLNETGGKFFLSDQKRARLTMVREYCDPYTLVRMLQERAVPRGFLFLKIDIDSVDLHVFDVIMREFRPTLVRLWSERACASCLPARGSRWRESGSLL